MLILRLRLMKFNLIIKFPLKDEKFMQIMAVHQGSRSHSPLTPTPRPQQGFPSPWNEWLIAYWLKWGNVLHREGSSKRAMQWLRLSQSDCTFRGSFECCVRFRLRLHWSLSVNSRMTCVWPNCQLAVQKLLTVFYWKWFNGNLARRFKIKTIYIFECEWRNGKSNDLCTAELPFGRSHSNWGIKNALRSTGSEDLEKVDPVSFS